MGSDADIREANDFLVTVYDETARLFLDIMGLLKKEKFKTTQTDSSMHTSTSRSLSYPKWWVPQFCTIYFSKKDHDKTKCQLGINVTFFQDDNIAIEPVFSFGKFVNLKNKNSLHYITISTKDYISKSEDTDLDKIHNLNYKFSKAIKSNNKFYDECYFSVMPLSDVKSLDIVQKIISDLLKLHEK